MKMPHLSVASLLRRFCILSFMILLLSPRSVAAQGGAQQLGTVHAQEFSTLAVAVPPFESTGERRFPDAEIADILYNDLYLSGFFHLPRNPDHVLDVHRQDLREEKIHHAEWHRLGISYLVKGKYKIEGDKLEAEVRTYDVAAGTFIFGKRYTDYTIRQVREMTHRIANDVHERTTGFPGAAHTKFLLVRETGRDTGRQDKEVFLMDADGANLRQLTKDGSLAATPCWGANATEFYYTTYKDYNPDLAGMFLDGSYAWFVSRRPGFNLSPDWSPVRRQLALSLTRDGNSEIYLMNREGKDLRRLTYDRAIDSSPSWSPDGKQIAFTSDRSGRPQVYVMDENGTGIRRISAQGNYSDSATWSPDGRRLAWCARVNGVFQIFIADGDGKNAQQLTFGNYNCEDPSWAPNNWVLAYSSDRTGVKQIYTMFIDGREIGRLTDGSASYSPDWSPMLP